MRRTFWSLPYATAVGLAGLLVAYAAMWLTVIWAVFQGNWNGSVFNLDIPNIVLTLSPIELGLITSASLFIAATLAGLVLRRRFAVYTAFATLVSHLAVWLAMSDNPYYAAEPGFVFLSMEGLLATLIVILVRRNVLR